MFFLLFTILRVPSVKAEWAEKCSERSNVLFSYSPAHSALTVGTFGSGNVMCLRVPSVKAEWAEKCSSNIYEKRASVKAETLPKL